MAKQTKPILVVGGGLGGLSAALAIGRRGRQVHILEQAPEIAPIGYGIQLGPNVFSVFDRLGVTEAVRAASHFPSALVMPDALTGEVLLNTPIRGGRFAERFRHPYVVIHRADIHTVLLDACKALPNVELTVNATVTGFEQSADGVVAYCENGQSFTGEALIGADGIKSRIREHFAPGDAPKPNGYVAHRTMLAMAEVPADLPFTDDVVLWAGPGFHVVHYPLRDRTLFNVVAVFRPRRASEAQGLAEYTQEVGEVYADAVPALKALLGRMDLEKRWVLADRDPIGNWYEGRVALLGDAVHPTYQTLAQGACMAIEDADCLAAALEGAGYDYPQAFRRYRESRLVRTARVSLTSRAVWPFFHEEGIAREVRNDDARTRTPEDFYNCVAWLWGGVSPGTTG